MSKRIDVDEAIEVLKAWKIVDKYCDEHECSDGCIFGNAYCPWNGDFYATKQRYDERIAELEQGKKNE